MTHTIYLKGYRATWEGQSTNRQYLYLGTAGSYGTEELEIVPDEYWAGLDIVATFTPASRIAVNMRVGSDYIVEVPAEATCKGGKGVIVFTGYASGVKRMSANMPYIVDNRTIIHGMEVPPPTPDLVQQILSAASNAESIAQTAADQALAATEQATNAATSAETAVASAEAAAADAATAQEAATAAAESAAEAAEQVTAVATSVAEASASAEAAAASAEAAATSASEAAESASNAESIAQSLQEAAANGDFDGNVMYATFDVDTDTGDLYMYTPDEYTGPEFVLTSAGYLEVKI